MHTPCRPLRYLIPLLFLVWGGPALPLHTGHTPARAQEPVPRYEPGACPFFAAPEMALECGTLIVPEDRSNPDSPTIRLAVAVARSLNTPGKPDPVIYLTGGPGGSVVEQMPTFWGMHPLRQDRDLIVLDQRGTGFSEPLLDCPELDDMAWQLLIDDTRSSTALEHYLDAAGACHDRLVASGANLAAYNSAENAADVADLRVALGYAQWNLYGISYGTRLALTVMRDHPEGIRSVVIDSVAPPAADGYATLGAQAMSAVHALAADCTADPACAALLPDLAGTLEQIVARLNAEPVMAQGIHPTSGDTFDILLTGNEFAEMVFFTLYSREIVPYLPLVIAQADTGDYSLTADLLLLWTAQFQGIAEGMHFSVMCQDEVAFTDQETMQRTAAEYPAFASFTLSQPDFEICKLWGVGQSPAIENEPVISDIPTLVLSGVYDPVTPPALGDLAAATLSHSYAYTFPSMGHAASLADGCPYRMLQAFFDDPTTAPDASCIDTIPATPFIVTQ